VAGRTRTTKKLAQRINRNYFKNRFTLARWRQNLSIALAAAGLIWLGSQALANRQKPYSSGPLAASHAFLGNNCNSCHVARAGFAKPVTDQACSACHSGPVHQAEQLFQPACAECHVEHVGAASLAQTSDKACASCHGDLKTRSGTLHVAARIESFESGHPEFTPLRAGQQDQGTIKFNHSVHMKKDLRGATGNVQMNCDDCHRTNAAARTWPYGQPVEAKPVDPGVLPAPHSRFSSRSYMEPVDYFRNCSTCHTLMFDKRISEPAPHKEPAVVKAFVVSKLEAYIAAHPSEIGLPEETEGRIPPRVPPVPARNAAEWVGRRVAQAETLLWGTTCKECHSLEFAAGDSVPRVLKANVTTRWLQRGNFDHSAHQMVVCTSCHTQALKSKLTSDVLLPGIKVCQSCHHSGQDAARATCSECHQYHDWNKEQHVEPALTIAVGTL
jgi:hypothetical protein